MHTHDSVSPPTVPCADMPPADLFAQARTANELRQRLGGNRCVFARSRRLLGTGTWQGPKDAADSVVEESDVPALGGLDAAWAAGAQVFVGASLPTMSAALALGMRGQLRVPYEAGEAPATREERLNTVQAFLHACREHGTPVEAVIPTPTGEPMGLDTLALFAACGVRFAGTAVVADFARLGHRLAQMALGFGANGLYGPIVSERALRLGANANNPAMTRKEVVVFIAGAQLQPVERLAGGRLEEVTP